jgi:hypothetical protein
MKSFFLVMFSVLLLTNINGQKAQFSTGYMVLEEGTAQVIKVDIYDSRIDIQNAFTAWMAEHYNIGLDGGKIIEIRDNTYSAKGAIFPRISNQLLNVYMNVEYGFDDELILRFYCSYGFDTYINREDNRYEYTAFYSIVKEFVNEYLVLPQQKATSSPASLM